LLVKEGSYKDAITPKENFGSLLLYQFFTTKKSVLNKKSSFTKNSCKFHRKFHNFNFIFCIIKIVAITIQEKVKSNYSGARFFRRLSDA
jgi:hypothetical protein